MDAARLVKIGEAAWLLGMLGTKPDTLRKWERSGKLLLTRNTRAGTRDYAVSDLPGPTNEAAPTLCHARVSSPDRKADWDRQQTRTRSLLRGQGLGVPRPSGTSAPACTTGSRALQRLLDPVLKRQIRRLVLTHKDRLLRFGAELVFALCERQSIEIVIIHQGDPPSFEEEPAQDVLEIITVLSARLYGSRSHQSRQLMENLQEASGS